MERKRITCPETAHLELIDLDRSPLGILIAECSRFLPRCSIDCSRVCAARMDRREHHERREHREQHEQHEHHEHRERRVPVAAVDHEVTALIRIPSEP